MRKRRRDGETEWGIRALRATKRIEREKERARSASEGAHAVLLNNGLPARAGCFGSILHRAFAPARRADRPKSPVLAVAAGEDAGDVVEHVGGADFVVAEVLDEALLDHVDLLLGLVVDHAGDQVLEFDGVA